MRRGTVFWGSLLILIGLLILLDNAGVFGDINVWSLIWPLFLIFLGGWILYNYLARSSTEIKRLNIPMGTSTSAHIRFDHGGGRLNVKAGINQEDLLSGDFGGGIRLFTEPVEDKAEIHLQMPQNLFPYVWIPGSSSDISWQVTIKNKFPISLSFNSGASESNIDLSELIVQSVVLKAGVSSTKLILPEGAGYTRVKIDAGVASIHVHIPDSVAARIRSSVGLGSVNIDRKRFPKSGSIYLSEDYEAAENKVDIDISSGIGSIRIG